MRTGMVSDIALQAGNTRSDDTEYRDGMALCFMYCLEQLFMCGTGMLF